MNQDQVPAAIRSLFDAMNAHDADAATAVADPDIEISIGPHVMTGLAAVRELATQEDPELAIETTPSSCEDKDGELAVLAHRVMRWRSSGEISSEEDVTLWFTLAADGRVNRARLA